MNTGSEFMETTVKYNSGNSFSFTHVVSQDCNLSIHLHDNYEVYKAISDNVRYFVEGTFYDLNSGDIIITNNREIHRPIITNKAPYERSFIQFSPSIFPQIKDINYNPLDLFTNRKHGHLNHIIIPEPAVSVVDKYFESIEACFVLNTDKSKYEARLVLNQLLIELKTIHEGLNIDKHKEHSTDPRIIKILEHLDMYFLDPFDLNEFSKLHHIDKYYLSHLFKSNTGFTLLEYIHSKRIQYAKLLIARDLSLNEISLSCGFNDYSNFFKTFKRLVGRSPKDYKRNIIQ